MCVRVYIIILKGKLSINLVLYFDNAPFAPYFSATLK